MVAKNDQKARLLDLATSVLELVRDGKRDLEQISRVLQAIKDNPNFAQELFSSASSTVRAGNLMCQLRDWKKFYQDVFGIKKDFSTLQVPEHISGFDRLIIVAKGMAPNIIYNKMKKLMPAWKYANDLDTITSDRKADKDYAIWIQDRVEADEELKNKSANDLKREGIQGITLEERLLYELKYFKETGNHLDKDSRTLCSGSRGPGGGVPYVYWYPSDGLVGVDWYDLSGAHVVLRARVVVS